jgi:RNA polymerase sigma factor (sigma-70 family)
LPQGKALLEQWLAGNDKAFEAFYDRYADFVFQLCMRLLQNKEEAEEICQDIFLKVAEKANTFKGDSTTTTWLYAITSRKCLDRLRQRKRKGYTVRNQRSQAKEDTLAFVDLSNPQADLEKAEQMHRFWQAMEKLPPRQKVAITLVFLEGLPQSNAAEALGIPLKALESLLQRGKKNLKQTLKSPPNEGFF